MLLPSDSSIPQNSLDPIPLDEQNWDDYNTGRVLVSGIIARTDARCVAPESSFAQFGPVVQATVGDALAASSLNLSIQSTATQAVINQAAGQGAVITDDDIASAPQATTLGSTAGQNGSAGSAGYPWSGGGHGAGSESVYTPAQIAAATTTPRDWTDSVIFHPHVRKPNRSKVGVLIGTGSEIPNAGKELTRRSQQTGGVLPGSPWGQPVAATTGHCSLETKPWGKLLLFAGLGLIGVGLLGNKK
jgi:hypothetical protein